MRLKKFSSSCRNNRRKVMTSEILVETNKLIDLTLNIEDLGWVILWEYFTSWYDMDIWYRWHLFFVNECSCTFAIPETQPLKNLWEPAMEHQFETYKIQQAKQTQHIPKQEAITSDRGKFQFCDWHHTNRNIYYIYTNIQNTCPTDFLTFPSQMSTAESYVVLKIAKNPW